MINNLRCLASQYEGALTSTDLAEPGGGRALDYDWQQISDLPLVHFGPRNDWVTWFNEWQPIYLEELGYDRLGEMVEYVNSDADDPIVAVRWKDGKIFLWDGNHRIAASHFLNRRTISTILGTLKTPT